MELTPHQWAIWFESQGEPSFRADQVVDWIYRKMTTDPESMTNLSKDTRKKILESFDCEMPKMHNLEVSEDSRTTKFAFRLEDGEVIESVLMDQGKRSTFCISTQAGCKLGCKFCATARKGFRRNLKTSEILGQIIYLSSQNGSVGNVVFMGMGEPLQNTEALLPALEGLVDPERIGLGRRRVTVSTAGIVDGIKELAGHSSRPNLALSLNSPFGPQRSELMPVNRKYPLGEVIAACELYSQRTARDIMLEYVMLSGVNTTANAAEEVGKIARRLDAKINLIAFNGFPGADYTPPEKREIAAFKKLLEDNGIMVIQRYRRGSDIAAGCGQLQGEKNQDFG